MSKINQRVFILNVLFNVPATLLITFIGSRSDTEIANSLYLLFR